MFLFQFDNFLGDLGLTIILEGESKTFESLRWGMIQKRWRNTALDTPFT